MLHAGQKDVLNFDMGIWRIPGHKFLFLCRLRARNEHSFLSFQCLPHSAPSWIFSQAENLASFSLQDGATEWYYYCQEPAVRPHAHLNVTADGKAPHRVSLSPPIKIYFVLVCPNPLEHILC